MAFVSYFDRLVEELGRPEGDDGMLAHSEQLRVSFHPGVGCEGPWTVEIVRSALSHRPIGMAVGQPGAIGHGRHLEDACRECIYAAQAIGFEVG